jgi:hypothetical protein
LQGSLLRLFVAAPLFFLLSLCSGCGLLGPRTPGLTIVRQKIDRDFYASAQVLSPDPRSANYPTGERLVIAWSLPAEWLEVDPLRLQCEVYYRNREKVLFEWPIQHKRGHQTVDCLGLLYQRTGGWMTYEVRILKDGQTLLAEPHQLWFRWMDLDDGETADEPGPIADGA